MVAIFVLAVVTAVVVVSGVDVLVVIAAVVLAVDVVGGVVLLVVTAVVAMTVISADCVSGVGRGGTVVFKQSKWGKC